MVIWTIFISILVMIPWIYLLIMLGMKYVLNKQITHHWRKFLISLGVCYLLVIIIAIIVFIGAPHWFKGQVVIW